MKRYKRKKKIKPHPLYGIYPNKTIIMARGNINVLWVWTGKNIPRGGEEAPELQMIAYSSEASNYIRKKIKEGYIHATAPSDWRPGFNGTTQSNLNIASVDAINSMTYIHPDYLQKASRHKTKMEKKDSHG